MSELKMDKGMTLNLYNGPEDLMNFKITVAPDDGKSLGVTAPSLGSRPQRWSQR